MIRYTTCGQNACWVTKKTISSIRTKLVIFYFIFYKLILNDTFKFKRKNCAGGKLPNKWITILLCGNMEIAVKRNLLVIGKELTHRAFINVNKIFSL